MSAMYDVIIVGAGVSGLTAAYRIQQKDPSVKLLLLEARDRVGGRTLTVPIKSQHGKTEMFDMGGQWVGWSQHHIMDLLQELNIDTFPQFNSGKKLMKLGEGNRIRSYTGYIPSLGSIRALVELQLFIWKIERMAREVDIKDPYSSKHAAALEGDTVESFMRKHVKHVSVLQTIEAACKGAFGAEPSRISALYFLAYANSAGGVMKLFETAPDTAQELRVKGGTQQISEKLMDKIGTKNIKLSTEVTSLTQCCDKVEIKAYCKDTSEIKVFTSVRVIVTIPPNLMTKVTFTPSLPPAKYFIYNHQPVGHLIKFIITYNKAFWRDAGYSGEIVSNGNDKLVDQECSVGPVSVTFDATSHDGAPALVGFIAGRAGVEWNNKTKTERCTAVLESLSEFLGPEAKTAICYEEKVWADDPYAGGCPVAFGVTGTDFALAEVRLPFERIHFAGTETATHWVGYISGAVQSGERAATEVLANIRPHLVTQDSLKDTCYDPLIKNRTKTNRRYERTSVWIKLLKVAIFVGIIAVIMHSYWT